MTLLCRTYYPELRSYFELFVGLKLDSYTNDGYKTLREKQILNKKKFFMGNISPQEELFLSL